MQNDKYREQPGDATLPLEEGTVIAHVCNDIGGWGAGFVVPLGNRYPNARQRYYEWSKGEDENLPFSLGNVQFVHVERWVFVANMIGQRGIFSENGEPPIRYDAIRECLQKVRAFCKEHNFNVQMPKIGSGLAGGDWAIISQIVREELSDKGIDVTVLTID
jgi:O-acetyl-ADP-ribose deacetylase (regulator of RNase III)